MPAKKTKGRTANGKKIGRPTKYNKALGERICARIMAGESLRSICRDADMPNRSNVFMWLASTSETYKPFHDQYARARAIQAEVVFDEIADIADDGSNDWMERFDKDGASIGWQLNGEHVQRSRLRIDTRKWAASKLLPKKYGDKTTHTHENADGKPLSVQLVIQPVQSNQPAPE